LFRTYFNEKYKNYMEIIINKILNEN